MKKKKYQKKSQSHHRKNYNKSAPKPWSWLLLGILMGLIIPVIIFLKSTHHHGKKQNVEKIGIASLTTAEEDHKKSNSKSLSKKQLTTKANHQQNTRLHENTANEKAKNQYEFYNMLSNEEDSKIKKIRTTEKISPPHYVLQIASFKTFTEADHMKAELIVMGYDVFISKVKQNDINWNRVNIGPYDDLKKIQQTKKDLQDRDIQSIIVEIK